MEQTVGYLFLHHIKLAVLFTLLQHLAAAHYGAYAVGKQLVHLAGYDLVGLVIVGTAFAVSHNAVLHLERFEHGRRHLSGICSALLVAHVLGSHCKVGSVAIVARHFQIGEGGTHDDEGVGIGGIVFQTCHDVVDKLVGFLECFVHFPVSCNNVFSHSELCLKVNCIIDFT